MRWRCALCVVALFARCLSIDAAAGSASYLTRTPFVGGTECVDNFRRGRAWSWSRAHVHVHAPPSFPPSLFPSYFNDTLHKTNLAHTAKTGSAVPLVGNGVFVAAFVAALGGVVGGLLI
jgi:hypothetical protein